MLLLRLPQQTPVEPRRCPSFRRSGPATDPESPDRVRNSTPSTNGRPDQQSSFAASSVRHLRSPSPGTAPSRSPPRRIFFPDGKLRLRQQLRQIRQRRVTDEHHRRSYTVHRPPGTRSHARRRPRAHRLQSRRYRVRRQGVSILEANSRPDPELPPVIRVLRLPPHRQRRLRTACSASLVSVSRTSCRANPSGICHASPAVSIRSAPP